MNKKIDRSAYSEKLQVLLAKNKQITTDLQEGKLTMREAAERAESISQELKNLTSAREKKD
jgi:ArsR family metal-binding transcriptional regulator